VNIVIAEDNSLLRDGLVMLLQDAGFTVTGIADNADDLLRTVEEAPVDLVITDVRMPPGFSTEGLQAALRIRAEHPDVAVLVLSQWVEPTYARQLLASNTGGIGYLLKDRVMRTSDFVAAVERVASGGTALDPEVVQALMTRPSVDEGIAHLTPREREVLALLAQGLTNQAIAGSLFLAIRSVEKVISSIFSKLGLTDDPSEHRRVMAVLRYLESEHQ
jgi:DNA-binding NarL/FixJ family response regulator